MSLLRRQLPEIPQEFQIYNSYEVDPKWQRKFTIIWCSVLAFTTVASIPWVVHAWRNRTLYKGLSIRESLKDRAPEQVERDAPPPRIRRNTLGAKVVRLGQAIWQSVTLWTIPAPSVLWKRAGDCCRRSYLSLSVGQIVLVCAYIAAVIACFTVGAELTDNSNRPGFLAVAQLPVVFLFSMKSPLPLPVFLPSLSYEHYNFIHRWAGRTTWLAATVHGALWLNQFIEVDSPELHKAKVKRGLISYGFLCMVVITSLKPVRRKFYQLFWLCHIAFVLGFFVAMCYHTTYAMPWVYVCVAFYAYDHFVRLLRYRFKDATIVPVDGSTTLIHIPDCDKGWLPTQHVNIRVLRGAGVFESHPFTITNAPRNELSSSPRGIVLYAKVAGDWTRRLHEMASDRGLEYGDDYEKRIAFLAAEEDGSASLLDHPGRHVYVTIDGPYGGLKMDLGRYESVLTVAGGSGVTFLLGSIESALCATEAGRGPRAIRAAWVVRELPLVEALAPTLGHLHESAERLCVELQLSIYLSSPPNPLPQPDGLPKGATVSPYRPEVAQLVREALPVGEKHGGLAVIAAGPEGLVSEARNAVASLSVSQRVRAGGVGFHDEVYCL